MESKQCANTGRCQECPYSNYAGIPRPIPKQADLVIVNSAPEMYEIRAKFPIAGPYGQIIMKLAERVGINLRDAFITSTLLCKQPEKTQPNKQVLDTCMPRLIEEIAAAKPKVIITLGNPGLHILSGDYKKKITLEQGRPFTSPYKELEGVIVIPTFHPGKLIRDPGAYRNINATMQYAADILKGSKLKDPGKSTYQLADSPQKVKAALDFLSNKPFVSADIETGSLNARTGDIITLGIGYDKNKGIIFPESALPFLKDFLENSPTQFIWHNGKFDTAFWDAVGVKARLDHDLMLLHYAVCELTGTHDLEQVSAEVAGFEPWEHHIKQYLPNKKVSYRAIPLNVLYQYLAVDIDATFQSFAPLLERVENDPDLKRLYYGVLLPASRFLQGVEKRGIYVNMEAVNVLEKRLDIEMEEAMEGIYKVAELAWDPEQYKKDTGAKSAKDVFSPRSPKQFAWLLYDRIGIKQSKQYGRSTSRQALELLEESGENHPIMKPISKMRSVARTIKEYVTKIREGLWTDGRLHTSFLLHGTATGRLASRGPNLQNVPSKPHIRSIFQSPPGRMLVEADYRAAELRMLAHLSGDPFLTSVFQEGRDLHTEVHIDVFGPLEGKDKQTLKDERMAAKTLNFGIPYGREAYSISVVFGVSVEEAQRWIDTWFARMPVAAAYLQSNADIVLTGKPQVTPIGRKKRVGIVNPSNLSALQNEARNFPMQSTASDMTLLSGIDLEEKDFRVFDEEGKEGAHVLNLVHDSILAECDNDWVTIYNTAAAMVETMARVPREVIQSKIPFEVEFKVGTAWGDMIEMTLEELAEKAGIIYGQESISS
jgi:uracil-DNA glycosylase family 4